MANTREGFHKAGERAAAAGDDTLADTGRVVYSARPAARSAASSTLKASDGEDFASLAAGRPARRYSFNMLVATALCAFAAGRLYGR